MDGNATLTKTLTIRRTMPIKRRKLVIVGNARTGKTCVLFRFRDDKFPEFETLPTVMDNYFTTCELDNIHYEIELWDTAGQEQFDRLRPMSYNNADVVIILYSVTNQSSFDNVKMLWAPEINRYCPTTPIILAGNKLDLQRNIKNKGLDNSSINDMAKSIRAASCIEISAKSGYNCQELLHTAIRLSGQKVCEKCHALECACKPRKKYKMKCTIL